MADTNMYIQEAASHITSAANQFERIAVEVLVALREGQFDREPVGSPPYVQRLRDQAAAALHAEWGDADWSVKEANALIRALGYEPPGEPGKEE